MRLLFSLMTKTYTDYKSAFSSLRLKFRLNEINDSIECNGVRMTDIEALTIESKMFDLGFGSAPGIKRNYTRLAGENAYHPILEWLDSLVWNGQDAFGDLMSYITFEYQAISVQFFRRFMLGCVGKIRNQDQNFMLTLDGVQGIGKSSLSAYLIPYEMRHYFVEGGLYPDHKDTKLRVISNFLWEVGELQGTTKKADLEALKNIITQGRMNVRKPYGHHDIDKPITCNFIGTVNESGAGFLNDITGNRRFAITKIIAIDWDYINIDISQVWAQINAAYLLGERGKLTRQEQTEQNIINDEYATLSHVEQYLFACFEIDLIAYQDDWTPVQKILQVLEDNGLSKSHQRMNQMELASILSKLKCQKSRSATTTRNGRSVCYNGLMAKASVISNIHIP